MLETLEQAICRGNYAETDEAFDHTFQQVDNLRDHLEDNISYFLDSINPEVIDLDTLQGAAQTVARMSAFVELIAHADYAQRTIKVGSIAAPDAIDSVHFSQRLSRDLYEASLAIKGREWDKAWDGLQGAMADLAILRDAVDSEDERYAESMAAEHVFSEIDRIEQFIHQQRKTSESRS